MNSETQNVCLWSQWSRSRCKEKARVCVCVPHSEGIRSAYAFPVRNLCSEADEVRSRVTLEADLNLLEKFLPGALVSSLLTKAWRRFCLECQRGNLVREWGKCLLNWVSLQKELQKNWQGNAPVPMVCPSGEMILRQGPALSPVFV